MDELDDMFRRVGCRFWLCAMDIDGPGEVAVRADEPVVAASVFKVTVALEFFRQVAGGSLDPRERVTLASRDRTPGPTGFSAFDDDVAVSLRDLARAMLVISDNAATDVLLTRVGVANANETARSLGLRDTVIAGTVRELVDSIGQDLGFADWNALAEASHVDDTDDRLASVRALRPYATTRTTAREMATLVRLIWRDEAGPPEACEQVRRLMATQLTRARLASGFPNGVSVSAKSGSLIGVVRNEVGVVRYPDGRRYAVAVFTRRDDPSRTEHEISTAIGAAAAGAVASLRA